MNRKVLPKLHSVSEAQTTHPQQQDRSATLLSTPCQEWTERNTALKEDRLNNHLALAKTSQFQEGQTMLRPIRTPDASKAMQNFVAELQADDRSKEANIDTMPEGTSPPSEDLNHHQFQPQM